MFRFMLFFLRFLWFVLNFNLDPELVTEYGFNIDPDAGSESERKIPTAQQL